MQVLNWSPARSKNKSIEPDQFQGGSIKGQTTKTEYQNQDTTGYQLQLKPFKYIMNRLQPTFDNDMAFSQALSAKPILEYPA